MKTVCTRCKNVIEYSDSLPEKCPYCGARYLYAQKTEKELVGDSRRSRIPDKLKNISPAKKNQRFMIPLAFLTDFLWLFVGLFMALRFYLFPRWIVFYIPYVGLVVTVASIIRFVYRVVMGRRLKNAIVKKKIYSVDKLIVYLALKTRTDVLVLFKKVTKWGFLIGYGVKMGTTIYKEEE